MLLFSVFNRKIFTIVLPAAIFVGTFVVSWLVIFQLIDPAQRIEMLQEQAEDFWDLSHCTDMDPAWRTEKQHKNLLLQRLSTS